MGFPWQEYWSGLPFPFLGGLPDPGIKPESPAFLADALPSEPPGKPSDSFYAEIDPFLIFSQKKKNVKMYKML